MVRARMKSAAVPPRAARLRQLVTAVKPPSAKNSGMIWPAQVAASNHGCASSGRETTIAPEPSSRRRS